MQDILNFYYTNNSMELRKMVDKVLKSLKFEIFDKDEFYSLANEIFVDVLNRFDKKRDFDDLLYTCLSNKFKTYMTRLNRKKRKSDKNCYSIDMPVGEDENLTLQDTLASDYSLEDEVFSEDEHVFSKEVQNYLDNLSPLQKKIAILIADGCSENEICDELHITKQAYQNSVKRMFANDKVKSLQSLI